MNKPEKSNTKIQTSKKTNYHWIKIEIDVMNKNVGKKKKPNEHFPFDLNWWDLRALRQITQSIAIRAQQPIYPLTIVTHQNKAKMPITHSSLVFAKPPMRDHDSRYGLSNLNVNLLATNIWNDHQIEMSSDSEAGESKEEVEELGDEMKGWWSWVTKVAIVSSPAL